ncbi:MAG: hypothetical protein D6808_05075, partial [Candidatus Dadabacteria bacterium]
MLKLLVVDYTADSRNKIVNRITQLQEDPSLDKVFLPSLSIKPVSVQELKFNSPPDIFLVGSELVENDISVISKIKKLFPDVPLLVELGRRRNDLAFIEDLVRLGADDTVSEDIEPLDFFKKLIVLCRRPRESSQGQLILVDSAKGGLGTTSIVAALGEALCSAGRKVALLDFDLSTQDLSRFLQTKPFVNENLQLLFDGARPVNEEFVQQCLVAVWEGEELYCMPPPHDREEFYDYSSMYPRTLLSILEILDETFDFVLVDSGSLIGVMLKTVYRVADKVIFVVNNDPASMYATVSKVNSVKGFLSPRAELMFLENRPLKGGLERGILTKELTAALAPEEFEWIRFQIPACRSAFKWPGSGDTMASRGSSGVKKSIKGVAALLSGEGEVDVTYEQKGFWRNFRKLSVKKEEEPIEIGDKEKVPLIEFAREQDSSIGRRMD